MTEADDTSTPEQAGSRAVGAAMEARRSALQELQLPPEPSPLLPAIVVGTSLLIFGIIAALMFRAGLFDAPETDTQSKVLAAVLVLVGTLLTESLVAAGLILKHSFDLRTYQLAVFEQQRLLAENERDHQLKVQEHDRLAVESEAADRSRAIEQERLRKDTVIKAIELLSDDAGNDAAPARQIGALQALATLGEYPLAVSLLDQRWSDPNSPVLPVPGAMAVLDCVFHADEPGIEASQKQASSVLLFNATKLITEDDATIPSAITDGTWLDLEEPIALNLLLTLCKASAAAFPGCPDPAAPAIRFVLSYLVVYARKESPKRNRLIAAHAALQLARALPRDAHTVVGSTDQSPDDIEQKMRQIIKEEPVPLPATGSIAILTRWADGLELGR